MQQELKTDISESFESSAASLHVCSEHTWYTDGNLAASSSQDLEVFYVLSLPLKFVFGIITKSRAE